MGIDIAGTLYTALAGCADGETGAANDVASRACTPSSGLASWFAEGSADMAERAAGRSTPTPGAAYGVE
jgi:hypothetical protein